MVIELTWSSVPYLGVSCYSTVYHHCTWPALQVSVVFSQIQEESYQCWGRGWSIVRRGYLLSPVAPSWEWSVWLRATLPLQGMCSGVDVRKTAHPAAWPPSLSFFLRRFIYLICMPVWSGCMSAPPHAFMVPKQIRRVCHSPWSCCGRTGTWTQVPCQSISCSWRQSLGLGILLPQALLSARVTGM